LDLADIAREARAERCRVVYLCSPNTPTGTRHPALDLAAWAAAHPELTLVLDQSFVSLSDSPEDAAVPMPSNVTRVRSLTKDHGTPGARVGYLLASPALCRSGEHGRPQWTTSAFAQAAAIASVERGSLRRSRRTRRRRW